MRLHSSILGIVLAATASLLLPASAAAHGEAGENFRTLILAVEPDGLPVDIRIVDGDQIRFENAGDKELRICGYDDGDGTCDEWVRIGPDGVFVDRNSRSYFANLDEEGYAPVPDDAGTDPQWEKLRDEPLFYTYHDHRVHWMGLGTPPNVDVGDSTPQKVFDAEVRFIYGDTEGVVKTRLEYVGGRSWLLRWGETLVVVIGIAAMLLVFALDLRRRRRTTGVGDQHEPDDTEPQHDH